MRVALICNNARLAQVVLYTLRANGIKPLLICISERQPRSGHRALSLESCSLAILRRRGQQWLMRSIAIIGGPQ